eukprot:PhF_6_TR40670/c0_g1_i2/m.61093
MALSVSDLTHSFGFGTAQERFVPPRAFTPDPTPSPMFYNSNVPTVVHRSEGLPREAINTLPKVTPYPEPTKLVNSLWDELNPLLRRSLLHSAKDEKRRKAIPPRPHSSFHRSYVPAVEVASITPSHLIVKDQPSKKSNKAILHRKENTGQEDVEDFHTVKVDEPIVSFQKKKFSSSNSSKVKGAAKGSELLSGDSRTEWMSRDQYPVDGSVMLGTAYLPPRTPPMILQYEPYEAHRTLSMIKRSPSTRYMKPTLTSSQSFSAKQQQQDQSNTMSGGSMHRTRSA